MPHDGCTGDADRSSQSNILSEWRNAMPHHMRASFASDVIVQKRRRRRRRRRSRHPNQKTVQTLFTQALSLTTLAHQHLILTESRNSPTHTYISIAKTFPRQTCPSPTTQSPFPPQPSSAPPGPHCAKKQPPNGATAWSTKSTAAT
jgi:hypothetical protein